MVLLQAVFKCNIFDVTTPINVQGFQIWQKAPIGLHLAAVNALKFGCGFLLLFGYFLKHW